MKWPLAISGMPSGATSARSVAEIEPSASKLLQSMRSASRRSRSDRLRASKLTARTPLPIGMMFACTSQGRAASSEPSANSSSPECGRVRLRWMFSNFDWWPLRTSSTTRLPLLRPISVRSPPSRPSAPRLSSQARKLAKPSCRLRLSPPSCAKREEPESRRRRPDRRERHRGRERAARGAGRHRHPAIGFDPDRELGADEVEAFGTRRAAEQARAREPDLGLRRARDQRPVAVADLDVADADGGAAVLVALQHRAADLDLKLVADVLGDRLGKPRRDDVEGNRAGGQAPIQPSADQEHHGERAGRDEPGAAHPGRLVTARAPEPSARGAAIDAKQLSAASLGLPGRAQWAGRAAQRLSGRRPHAAAFCCRPRRTEFWCCPRRANLGSAARVGQSFAPPSPGGAAADIDARLACAR